MKKKYTYQELKDKFHLDSSCLSQVIGKDIAEKIDGKWVYNLNHPLIKVIKKYGTEPLCTKTEAIKEFRIKDDEIDKLISFPKKNPYYKSAPPMQLFFKKQLKEFIEKFPRTERKIRKKPERKIPEITIENVSESLYVINKKAKEYRDKGKFHRMKKKELYSLKDEVLKLSIKEGMAHVKGYHKQINERYKYQMESYYNRLDYDESFGYDDAFMPSEFFYLKLIEMNGYTFHVPIDEPEGLFLGEIPIISAEKQATNITVSQAKLILKTFLKQNDWNLITI